MQDLFVNCSRSIWNGWIGWLAPNSSRSIDRLTILPIFTMCSDRQLRPVQIIFSNLKLMLLSSWNSRTKSIFSSCSNINTLKSMYVILWSVQSQWQGRNQTTDTRSMFRKYFRNGFSNASKDLCLIYKRMQKHMLKDTDLVNYLFKQFQFYFVNLMIKMNKYFESHLGEQIDLDIQ